MKQTIEEEALMPVYETVKDGFGRVLPTYTRRNMHVRVYFEMMPELIPSKKEDTYNELFEKAL